mgnify:CR=1 FL=1
MDAEGRPALVPDCSESDVFHTPSAVHIANNAAFVGRMAEQLLSRTRPSRSCGSSSASWACRSRSATTRTAPLWYPEGVSALLLKKLAFDVPRPWRTSRSTTRSSPCPRTSTTRSARQTLAAATLADMEVLGLVEEPVAAALHYGVVKGIHDQVLLVYDFGGGTFDAHRDEHGRARRVTCSAKTGLTELGGKESTRRSAP